MCGSGTMPWTAAWTRRTLLYKYAQKHVLFMQTGLESMVPRCGCSPSASASLCVRACRCVCVSVFLPFGQRTRQSVHVHGKVSLYMNGMDERDQGAVKASG